ncbi:MAG: UDP-N-acetylmuramate--L-alanine ligase [Alphaproteobacteria bacterium]
MQLPRDLAPIHFVGIGGIGMSGIAEMLLNLGYQVQGSDLSRNANAQRLEKLGATIHQGHHGDNLGEAEVVVVSTAVKGDNPEVVAARERNIPVIRRAEMLAELMRLKWSVAVGGTHGKTTTTSIVAALMEAGGLDPTVINGGIINAYGTNARMGAGEWMVVEADESDGTFNRLPHTAAIVTNIDPEHLDHYGSFDALKQAFHNFVATIPFYGFAALCIDDENVQTMMGALHDRRITTYGFSAQADLAIQDLTFKNGAAHFDLLHRDPRTGDENLFQDLVFPMPGRHNVQNATGAIAVALELGMDIVAIKKGLAGFGGVKRRFTKVGTYGQMDIIDDYAHHPVEIKAVLSAARQAYDGKVVAVVQPHRYTRLRDLFDEFCTAFNDADLVIVADVFEAGESHIPGFDKQSLVDGLKARGHRNVIALESESWLGEAVRQNANDADVIVLMGAGSITQWAYELPNTLEALSCE